jgi:hypothetical protein
MVITPRRWWRKSTQGDKRNEAQDQGEFAIQNKSGNDPKCFSSVEETYEHNSANYSHSSADWSAAHLAAQPRLGYYPSGGLGLILVIVIILALLGTI